VTIIIAFPREKLLTSFPGLKWCKDELRKSPQTATLTLAKRWHELMAPIRHTGNDPDASLSPGSQDRGDEGNESRSIFRRTMYQALEQEAKRVCTLLVGTCGDVSYPFIKESVKNYSQLA
jgi:hypothetical protein